jgi:hypothetical protein
MNFEKRILDCIFEGYGAPSEWTILGSDDRTDISNIALREFGTFSSSITSYWHVQGPFGIHFVLNESGYEFSEKDEPGEKLLDTNYVPESDHVVMNMFALHLLTHKPDLNEKDPFGNEIALLYWSTRTDEMELERASISADTMWIAVLKTQERMAYVLDVIGRLGQLTVS